MSSIKGTNVLAPVVPFDTTDAHASHEARYGKGGYRSVADIAERDALPALRREAGMLVCVLTDGKVWRLGDNLTTWTEFAVSSDWATLSGKPSTFTPTSHTHTASQITDFSSAVVAAAPSTTDASLLTSGTLSASRLPTSVVLTTDGRLSDARTPTAHSHAVADVTGLQTALDSKQAAGSYASASHTHTAGQVSGLAAVATSGSYADLTSKPTIPAAVTSLPAASITGLATVATSGSYADLSGRPTLFSGAYADLTGVPASFAPSAHNQAWSTITSTPTTLGGYGITDAVGSSDSRLSDSRSPTSHASSHASGGADALTLAASQIGSGTLEDARLSSNVVTATALHARFAMPTTAVETFPRMVVSFLVMTSGGALHSFFTPLTTVTVSQITMLSGATAAAGLTLARMGLFTYDESTGTATLVARCASDTTLFTATRTAYTRSFDTAGSFPSSYQLVAGTRYGIALLCVGTTMPTIQGNSGLAEMSALSPRLSAIRTSQSDLSTGTATNAQSQVLYARLS